MKKADTSHDAKGVSGKERLRNMPRSKKPKKHGSEDRAWCPTRTLHVPRSSRLELVPWSMGTGTGKEALGHLGFALVLVFGEAEERFGQQRLVLVTFDEPPKSVSWCAPKTILTYSRRGGWPVCNT